MLLDDFNHALKEKGHGPIASFGEVKELPSELRECLGPGPKFRQFVAEVMMWSESTQIRLNKASRDAANWDHDDMDMFAPHLSDDQVDKICRFAGGARQQVSTPGLLNASMGFNDAIKIKMGMLKNNVANKNKKGAISDVRHITDMLKSQIRFHAIVDTRYDATNANLEAWSG